MTLTGTVAALAGATACLALTGLAPAAEAATISLAPTTFGSVDRFNGSVNEGFGGAIADFSVADGDEFAIYEFDLSSIPDAATITAATLALGVSTGSSFGNIGPDVIVTAFAGDGAITFSDSAAPGSIVSNDLVQFTGGSFDQPFSSVPDCAVCLFEFDDLSPLAALLGGDLLTLRVALDGEFNNAPFIIEFGGANAVKRLDVTFDAPDAAPIPLPATAPLLLAAVGAIVALRRRRRG
jgi:hypothetical protein